MGKPLLSSGYSEDIFASHVAFLSTLLGFSSKSIPSITGISKDNDHARKKKDPIPLLP